MKNKQNEANGYKCVLCETGEGDKHGSKCDEIKEYYNNIDLAVDLDWFNGLNIDEEEAKQYIKSLLNKTPTKNLEL